VVASAKNFVPSCINVNVIMNIFKPSDSEVNSSHTDIASAVQIHAFAFCQSSLVFIGQKCVGMWLSVVDNLQSFSPVPVLYHVTSYFHVTLFILGVLYRVKK
jgi:hypothetical protein